MYVTAFIIVLIVVIMFHEFGHYATAKAFGMKVDRFFLGFGPTLWSVRKGETEYGVKAIPAGGFVRIVGMTPFEKVAEEDRGRTFYEQAAWKRAIVLAAGSATHFVVAAAFVFIGLVAIGPPLGANVVAQVVPGTPAADAGLREGDRVVAVDGERTRDFEDVRRAVVQRGGETVPLTIVRDGEQTTIAVDIAPRTPTGVEQGFLGVGPRPVGRLPVGDAVRATFAGRFSVPQLTVETLRGLGQVFSPSALAEFFTSATDPGPRDPNSPTSVVGISQAVGALGAAGEIFLVLLLVAQLNIVLGTLNMLPLPPLDGGHLAVLLIEQSVNGVRRALGREDTWRIDPAVITPVAVAVILLFVVLSLTAIYVDITKPVSELLQ